MSGRLSGKVALVTGSTRRIGSATVKRLAADGASVVVTTRANKPQLDATVKSLEASGAQVMGMLADLTDEAQLRALIDTTIARFGGLDIIVSNAVDRNHDTLDKLSLDAWRHTFAVAVEAGVLLAKHAAPHLRSGGSIIFFGGGAAYSGAAAPAQPSSKMAMVGLTRSLATALGPKGVRVNLIAPGRIEAVEDGPERLAMLRRNRPDETIPLRRAGNVEDIADAVAALVSDDMRYVTGQCLHVNGGIYMD